MAESGHRASLALETVAEFSGRYREKRELIHWAT
jgi:hypothetical protein